MATSFATTLVCFPAYAPFDLAVFATTFFLSKGRASLATAAPDTKPPAITGALVASGLFSAAATYRWLRGSGNLWGPKSTAGLPLYALATSGIIAFRLLTRPTVRGVERAGSALTPTCGHPSPARGRVGEWAGKGRPEGRPLRAGSG